MDDACARSSSRSPLGPSHGAATEIALPQLLPLLHDGVKAFAADGDRDVAGSSSVEAARTGKRRSAARAGLARGVRVLLSGVAEMVGKRFERSIPAAKFGHVAYIR